MQRSPPSSNRNCDFAWNEKTGPKIERKANFGAVNERYEAAMIGTAVV
jgi:hypothetical protein